MLTFNFLDFGNFKYRCVLGERYYFDFSISQYELFGYMNFFKVLESCEGTRVFDLQDKHVGEVVSVKYSRLYKEISILLKIGIGGELFFKSLKGA